jgi:hypothetical protein
LNRTIAARWRGWPSQPALSLGGLRRRIEALLPDEVRVVLQLDGLAERERHRRRAKMGVTAP